MLSQSTHRIHDRKWDMRRKRILLIICFPIIFMMYLVVFTTFYLSQVTNFCSWFGVHSNISCRFLVLIGSDRVSFWLTMPSDP